MVRQRVYGIPADCEDRNDHDTPRTDPVFKPLADRPPDGPDLAGRPTLPRFENAVPVPDLWRLRDLFVDLFIRAFDEPPAYLTLDVDPFDDPAHGGQQLIMFHGYHDQYQYPPVAITRAENDMTLPVGLRHGTCEPYLGVDNDPRYLTGRLRAAWPDVHVHVRADSGPGVPLMYDVCREPKASYTFGTGVNARPRAVCEDLEQQALKDYRETGQARRSFRPVDYPARGWSEPQPVVIRVEANAQGLSRRAAVTNRPGCRVLPAAVYDGYAMRGESGNRNKELKVEPHAGRLSDHRFLANHFRLRLHAATLNLPVRLRHAVVQPPPVPAEPGQPAGLPTEAIDGPARKTFFNRRRERDPSGEGFAWAWRTRLIKVAAEVITRARRVIVRLSGDRPHVDHFRAVSRAVRRPPAGCLSPRTGRDRGDT